jgi:hypothetical protein
MPSNPPRSTAAYGRPQPAIGGLYLSDYRKKLNLTHFHATKLEGLFTSSFFPLINKPTRITTHTATLIDNIYTNNFEKINCSTSGVIISDISDHLPIVHSCNMDNNKQSFNSKDNKIRYMRIIINQC